MKSFADVMEFRRSPEAIEFAERWLADQETGDVTSDWHMNLLAWTLFSPFHVLGIVLNLIDLCIDGENEELSEMVMLGPVQWLVERSPEDFASILKEAVAAHPGFELFTRGKRGDPDKPRWMNLA